MADEGDPDLIVGEGCRHEERAASGNQAGAGFARAGRRGAGEAQDDNGRDRQTPPRKHRCPR